MNSVKCTGDRLRARAIDFYFEEIEAIVSSETARESLSDHDTRVIRNYFVGASESIAVLCSTLHEKIDFYSWLIVHEDGAAYIGFKLIASDDGKVIQEISRAASVLELSLMPVEISKAIGSQAAKNAFDALMICVYGSRVP